MSLPMTMRGFGVKRVTIIRNEGTDSEEREQVEAHIQADKGYFGVSTRIYEGNIVVIPDPRGGESRRVAEHVKVNDYGAAGMQHIAVTFGNTPPQRSAPVRRLGLENLHPEVLAVASDLFTDGHYSQAVYEACKALEVRVRQQSGLDESGKSLMTKAFSGSPPPIDVSIESGRSGADEQEGLRFIFMGVIVGIRNPKGHALVKQDDPQRALEYLAMASVLFRRLDDAQAKSP